MTYWTQRALDSIGRMESAVNGALPELVKSFEDARQELQKEIDAFYGRYARNNAITLEDAQRALSLSELREFKGNLKEYEKLARDSIGTFNLQVDNLSVKARITRLQALETQCDAVLQKLYQAQRRLIERTATNVFTEEYYRSQFAIEQYTGFQFQFSAPATAVIQRVLKEPVQGADISTRLWRQDIDTGFRIRQTLNQMFTTGKPPQYFAEELQKAIGAVRTNPDGTPGGTGKKYEAYRLLYNESAYASGQANLESYKADGLDAYEIIATLDFKTSDICREQDSKHYPVDKAVTGETFPPFHVNCRTATAPYIPDLKSIKSTRMARDPETGKSVRVEKQSYEKWREGLSARMGQDKLATAEKMARNESTDFSQYQEYKAVLGKDAPKSFASFQDLKYNNSNEWGILQAQQRGMGYYNRAVKNEPAVTKAITDTAAQIGVKTAGLEFRIKSKDSYLRKIRSNYSPVGNAYEIKDILRYTYTASPDSLTEKILAGIDALEKNGYETIQIKNTWNVPFNPYKGINTVVRAPNGQKFELQYHTPESFALKNGELHSLYEKARLLDADSEERKELNSRMAALSKALTIPTGIERVK